MVHPKHGARSACVRRSQEFSAPGSYQAGQSSHTTAATTRPTPTAATGYSRQKRCLGRSQDHGLDRIPSRRSLHRCSSLSPVVFCIPIASTRFILHGQDKVARCAFGPLSGEWSLHAYIPNTNSRYKQQTSENNQKEKNLHTVILKPKTQRRYINRTKKGNLCELRTYIFWGNEGTEGVGREGQGRWPNPTHDNRRKPT